MKIMMIRARWHRCEVTGPTGPNCDRAIRTGTTSRMFFARSTSSRRALGPKLPLGRLASEEYREAASPVQSDLSSPAKDDVSYGSDGSVIKPYGSRLRHRRSPVSRGRFSETPGR